MCSVLQASVMQSKRGDVLVGRVILCAAAAADAGSKSAFRFEWYELPTGIFTYAGKAAVLLLHPKAQQYWFTCTLTPTSRFLRLLVPATRA